MDNLEKLLVLLEYEYNQGKRRQLSGATKDSGFMRGISKAMQIVENLKKD